MQRGRKTISILTMRCTHSKLYSVIWKSKCIVVTFEEHDEISNGVPSWIPVFIEFLALM